METVWLWVTDLYWQEYFNHGDGKIDSAAHTQLRFRVGF